MGTYILKKKSFRVLCYQLSHWETETWETPSCSKMPFLLMIFLNCLCSFYNIPTALTLLPLAAYFSTMSSKLAVWISSFAVTFRYLSLRLQCLLKGCTGWQCFGSEDEMHPDTKFWILIISWPTLTIHTFFTPLTSRWKAFSYSNISFG